MFSQAPQLNWKAFLKNYYQLAFEIFPDPCRFHFNSIFFKIRANGEASTLRWKFFRQSTKSRGFEKSRYFRRSCWGTKTFSGSSRPTTKTPALGFNSGWSRSTWKTDRSLISCRPTLLIMVTNGLNLLLFLAVYFSPFRGLKAWVVSSELI